MNRTPSPSPSRCRALIAATIFTAACCGTASADPKGAPTQYNDLTVAQLQSAMAAGTLSSEALTHFYLARIALLDTGKSGVNSVIELNPDAIAQARTADRLRRQGTVLGPLHGIPVLMKDNIGTGDRMQTSAGSFGLIGMPAASDSTVAGKVRAGGAVLLGKTNLSEWANFRSFSSISGWSGRGGQTHNPYGLSRNPCGSSSGSGAAATANFAAVTLATETDGSIVCPAAVSGIVGLKPTVGLTSRAGAVPLSRTQDSIGAHARTVADAAIVLSVMQSRSYDGRDPATGGVPLGWTGRPRPADIPTDYTRFLNPHGLRGARIGITRQGVDNGPAVVVQAWEAAVERLRAAGATVIDLDASGFTFPPPDGELLVLLYDFRDDLRNYLATRTGVPLAGGSLADAIAYNNANADVEMPFFGQDIFELAQSLAPGANDPQPAFAGLSYKQALEIDRLSGVKGIDKALRDYQLDGIAAPTGTPAWTTDLLFGDNFLYASSGLAAAAGYPVITVPAAMVFGLPFGVSFFGTAFSEPTLIKLASGFEAVTQVRRNNPPTFARTMPNYSIRGTSPFGPAGGSKPPAVKTPTKPDRSLPLRRL
jgi:amidase